MPTVNETNCRTGETVIRDFNETELAQFETNKIETDKNAKAKAKADKALADKRQIILDRLGLTADEFQTLIS
jgi:hypothetical protein